MKIATKVVLAFIFVCVALLAWAALTPSPVAGYVFSGGNWAPLSGGGSGTTLGYTPSPVGLYTWTGSAWQPWAGGGGAPGGAAGGDLSGTYPNPTVAKCNGGTCGTVTSISTTAPITGGTITSTGTIGFAGTDINASGNVVASHLSAALPVAQGGTGTTNYSGLIQDIACPFNQSTTGTSATYTIVTTCTTLPALSATAVVRIRAEVCGHTSNSGTVIAVPFFGATQTTVSAAISGLTTATTCALYDFQITNLNATNLWAEDGSYGKGNTANNNILPYGTFSVDLASPTVITWRVDQSVSGDTFTIVYAKIQILAP